MSRLNVVPIVEGHGEQKSAIRTVVRRVWTELLGGDYVNVLRPIREPRSKLITREGLIRAVQLADIQLRQLDNEDPSLVLVLFDADEDLPCVLAPRLLEVIHAECGHLEAAVVLPNPEFETWFAAAAESLTQYFDLSVAAPSADPEAAGQRKGAVRRWMRGRYSETIDQVRLTEAMTYSSAARDLARSTSSAGSFRNAEGRASTRSRLGQTRKLYLRPGRR